MARTAREGRSGTKKYRTAGDFKFLESQNHFRQGRVSDALAAIQQALVTGEPRLDVLKYAAEVALAAQEIEFAEKILRRARRRSGDAEVLTLLGRLRLLQGNSQGALKVLEEVRPGEETQGVRRARSEAFVALGRWEVSVPTHIRTLYADPGDDDTLFRLALSYLEIGRIREAGRIIRQLEKKFPENSQIRFLSCRQRFSEGAYGIAWMKAKRLVDEQNNQMPALRVMGDVEFFRGRLTQASRSYEALFGLGPQSPNVILTYGLTKLLSGEGEAARQIFDLLIDRDDVGSDARLLQGLAKIRHLGEASVTPPDPTIPDMPVVGSGNPSCSGEPPGMVGILCADARETNARWFWENVPLELVAPAIRSDSHWDTMLDTRHRVLAEAVSTDRISCEPRIRSIDSGDPGNSHSRIRLGLLGTRWGSELTNFVACEVMEHLDRSRVEILGYGLESFDEGAMRSRFVTASDGYVDLSMFSIDRAIRRIRSDELDVLIDTCGMSIGAKAAVCVAHPAKIVLSGLCLEGFTGPHVDAALTGEGDQGYLLRQVEGGGDIREVLQWDGPPFPVPKGWAGLRNVTVLRSELGLQSDRTILGCCIPNGCWFAEWLKLVFEIASGHSHVDVCFFGLPSEIRSDVVNLGKTAGIAENRIFSTPPDHFMTHMKYIGAMDLVLDPFPQDRVDVTAFSVSAGVPVVVLEGNWRMCRRSAVVLRRIGLDRWIASSPEHYSRIASDQIARLTSKTSAPIDMDVIEEFFSPARFARLFERAIATACKKDGVGSGSVNVPV